MEEKESISQYRDKLDKTLMSHDLSNMEFLRTLVENQMSKSTQSEDQEINDNLIQKRTKEVANFLSMLKSASGNAVESSKANEIPHGGWKIKQDNEDCRVMYKEGPAGTPFHNLLVEGYVDGPLDVCMCVTWEAGLYPKWWPQFNIPAFKIIYSECEKKVRMGEQISLVRIKLSWPLSTREALVHFVNVDYFQEDLIILLLNTIPETENIEKSTHGFTRDGIPGVENVTRIDVVGGVVLQKVSANRSYFRAIANMDIKLDFVPPAIINFISRQIIGSGFKLFKKKVASVTKGDVDFSKALKDPFYGNIREALYSENKFSNGISEQKEIKIDDGVLEQNEIKIDDGVLEQETVNVGPPEERRTTKKEIEDENQLSVSDIEETEETYKSCEDNDDDDDHNNIIISDELYVDGNKEIVINPEVNQALGTLEKVISIFREFRFSTRSLSLSRSVNNVFTDLEDDKSNGHKHLVNELTMRNSQESNGILLSHGSRHKVHEAVLAENGDINRELIKNMDESSLTQKKVKKQRFCCLSFTSGRLNS
ncbi:putative START-like domain superfamily protein [Helianthus debilis subsp. tardiflorus]